MFLNYIFNIYRISTPSLKCSACSKDFKTRSGLWKHEKKCQTIRKPAPKIGKIHKCTDCEKTFASAQSLQRHLQLPQCKEKKSHVCGQCSKVFDKLSKLKRHETKHVTKQVYNCWHCNLHYVRQDKYILHLNSSMHHENVSFLNWILELKAYEFTPVFHVVSYQSKYG